MESRLFLAQMTRQFVSGMQRHCSRLVSPSQAIVMMSHLLLSHLMESRLFLAQTTRQFVSGMQRHCSRLVSPSQAITLMSHLLLSHLMESRLFLAQMTRQFVSGMQRHCSRLVSPSQAITLLSHLLLSHLMESRLFLAHMTIPYSAIMDIFFQHTSFQMITGFLALMKSISSGFLLIFLIYFPFVFFLVLPILLHYITLMIPILFMVSSGKNVFQMFRRVM